MTHVNAALADIAWIRESLERASHVLMHEARQAIIGRSELAVGASASLLCEP
jgi:hypothetical protein